jgi:hypothetical protein
MNESIMDKKVQENNVGVISHQKEHITKKVC